MTYGVYNPGGLGDCFLTLNLCKLIKCRFPNEKVIFFLSKNSHDIIKDIIKLQDCVDYIGYIENNEAIVTFSKSNTPPELIKKIYLNRDYYTDLTLTQAIVIDFINDYGMPKNYNNISSYELGTSKQLSNKLTVAVNDKSDWVRKRKYDLLLKDKITNLLKSKYNADIVEIGQDNGLSYLENLRQLNNCHLYLGFFGSLAIFAGGIDVDTITYPTVMPPSWAHNSFYSSGWHKQVLPKAENHCKYYSCIEPRPYYYPRTEPTKIQGQLFTQFLGPPIIKNHNDIWAETCNYTPDGKSCISKMTLEDIESEIKNWLYNRWNK